MSSRAKQLQLLAIVGYNMPHWWPLTAIALA